MRRLVQLSLAAGAALASPAPSPAAPVAAPSASFDCARASTRVERLVCGDPLLRGYDQAVAATYRRAVAERRAPAVAGEQRAWLRERDACTTAACVRDAYADRLGSLFLGLGHRAPYKRADGADLTMVPLGGGFNLFRISAESPPGSTKNVNIGEISGVILASGGAGSYRRDACRIAFRAAGSRAWLVTVADDFACEAGRNVKLGGRFAR